MTIKRTFKPIDSAFAILFLLLLAVSTLHLATASDIGAQQTPAVLQVTADLERLRALEKSLGNTTDLLRRVSMDRRTKLAIVDVELERIENALVHLGMSAVRVPGSTRLVEPYMQIREIRQKMQEGGPDVDDLLASGSALDRALEATRFVVRGNITRLGEEQSMATASLNGFSNRARWIALFGSLAAVLVFAPVRLMAQKAAAKPLRALKAATRAVTDDRWNALRLEGEGDDAVGELVSAFNTMALQLRESREERANTFRRTLSSLVQAIEAKDAYVSNHSCNVSKFAELLGRAVDLPEAEVREIGCSALLHDIGKIGIPDEIINKPGKLTSQEFSVIEEHPVIGHRIVTPLDGAEALMPPVRHHHEHWDGTGYPDGLRGEQIPLHARIVAIADVFEALTSDRPYRKRMSVEQAVDVMRRESGKTLDPKLVDAFITKVLPQIRPQLETPSPDPDPNDAQTAGRPRGDELKALTVP